MGPRWRRPRSSFRTRSQAIFQASGRIAIGLLQVFENLIGNALKFTHPGGRITVGAAPRAGETLFWVADTGSGIASEDVVHVFDRFWQSRKADRRGAGLGLSIVKGIVEAHGGRIWVESLIGRGSTFFFTIPAAPPAPIVLARK